MKFKVPKSKWSGNKSDLFSFTQKQIEEMGFQLIFDHAEKSNNPHNKNVLVSNQIWFHPQNMLISVKFEKSKKDGACVSVNSHEVFALSRLMEQSELRDSSEKWSLYSFRSPELHASDLGVINASSLGRPGQRGFISFFEIPEFLKENQHKIDALSMDEIDIGWIGKQLRFLLPGDLYSAFEDHCLLPKENKMFKILSQAFRDEPSEELVGYYDVSNTFKKISAMNGYQTWNKADRESIRQVVHELHHCEISEVEYLLKESTVGVSHAILIPMLLLASKALLLEHDRWHRFCEDVSEEAAMLIFSQSIPLNGKDGEFSEVPMLLYCLEQMMDYKDGDGPMQSFIELVKRLELSTKCQWSNENLNVSGLIFKKITQDFMDRNRGSTWNGSSSGKVLFSELLATLQKEWNPDEKIQCPNFMDSYAELGFSLESEAATPVHLPQSLLDEKLLDLVKIKSLKDWQPVIDLLEKWKLDLHIERNLMPSHSVSPKIKGGLARF